MTLGEARHWVFDMDGTLTVAVHDFALIRRELDIPAEDDILHHLAALPAEAASRKRAWLLDHERELARASRPAVGAVALVRALCERGCRLGILTRNAHELALVTLKAIGLDDCFAADDILGRDEAPPKPHPGGLLHLAERWGVAPGALVMVGDHRMDLQCARAAGAHALLVNLPENPWPEWSDGFVRDCAEVLAGLGS
ncbi:HAD family hydrolase [Pseudomonas kuykendallii]|uniref:Haloacid dehalogenase superfamily, subfamily IA, variant 3 with third motif having DD or ED/haloacid dehalogenase superfamily, subfamily IA, variant 1 with third motif having Dx(3-4)D or Dx(3-4)E n=1 Tax=Pseudomonas kuykendallii TaxID=1007099 RepID=A0A1H2WDT3_9PSED|nr:HAD family hydrolase [Pseudomonas kuykendallii]MCQ4273073.1 HAD family hydrolase [Pseudomonas kuykendallii]SDW78687.1 haloacid dehalogenase superfamily, subfamily IA, variant 3 with third motif having DD or ED/haloacid dehalogenase superfamily, subfamily IA, variant 1 with third motif having Dx(3-4)D or Dx(3-4)E [Pseudomonas kuykendallii]